MSEPPLLYICHRHADAPIADVLRRFVTDRSGGRITVFQSSSADADNPRVGRELHRELRERLWAAGVIVLVYTSPDDDWSYCMWECGVATLPAGAEAKIVVLQCGQRPPAVYADAVRVKAVDLNDVRKFTNEFLCEPDFFPDSVEAVAPGFAPHGEEVHQAAEQLHTALADVLPATTEEGEDWATVPFVRLQLSYTEVDAIRKMTAEKGRGGVLDAARIRDIDDGAKRLFGLGRVDTLSPFGLLVDGWRQARPEDQTGWIDELAEQVRVGSHWRFPRFGWRAMRSVDDADRARYAPVLARVRSVPRQRCHHFDVYFGKFDTVPAGDADIGFLFEV